MNCSLTLFIYLLFLLWQSCNFDLFANSMSTFSVSFFQKRKLLKVSIFLYIQIQTFSVQCFIVYFLDGQEHQTQCNTLVSLCQKFRNYFSSCVITHAKFTRKHSMEKVKSLASVVVSNRPADRMTFSPLLSFRYLVA